MTQYATSHKRPIDGVPVTAAYGNIYGQPKPQPRPRARQMGALGARVYVPTSEWRKTLKRELRRLEPPCIAAPKPVYVHLSFRIERPKCHYRTGKFSHILKPTAPPHPTSRQNGDLDNIVKATLDEFDGVLFDSDAQVIDLQASMRFAGHEELPGVLFEVALAMYPPEDQD